MVIVGALWDVADRRGWALMAVFVVARFASGWLGTKLAELGPAVSVTPDARRALAVSPLGALSIAIVVNAQMLYPGGTIPLIATAVLGGGIVTEIVFQLVTRNGGTSAVREGPSVDAEDEEVL
jgi:hypothetical protein